MQYQKCCESLYIHSFKRGLSEAFPTFHTKPHIGLETDYVAHGSNAAVVRNIQEIDNHGTLDLEQEAIVHVTGQSLYLYRCYYELVLIIVQSHFSNYILCRQ